MKNIRRGLDILTEEARSRCIKEIIGYFQDERNETIGIIAAEDVLDFFLQNIAPDVYNKAVEDTKTLLKKQLEGLDFELDLLKKQK
ncbi:MAG: DUF2164 family protein [Candidatus Magasanikbacteria bacterium]|nr:DUF2164 family protein [Candidatus Magasanikbacteria bacterium]